MHDLDLNDVWLNHNGKIVMLRGIKHVLRVSTHRAVFPYRHIAISVSAEPLNKNTKYFQKGVKELKDQWSIDVLSSDFDFQCEILRQVG